MQGTPVANFHLDGMPCGIISCCFDLFILFLFLFRVFICHVRSFHLYLYTVHAGVTANLGLRMNTT